MTRSQAMNIYRQMVESKTAQALLNHLDVPITPDTRRPSDLQAVANLLREMAQAIDGGAGTI